MKRGRSPDGHLGAGGGALRDAGRPAAVPGREPAVDLERHSGEPTVAAHRAIELNPDLADGHNALGNAAWVSRDWPTAEQGFRRALELNPKHVQARCWYGLYFLQICSARMAEGVDEAGRALELDPLSAYVNAIYAMTLAAAGRIEEAVEQPWRSRRPAIRIETRIWLSPRTIRAASTCGRRRR